MTEEYSIKIENRLDDLKLLKPFIDIAAKEWSIPPDIVFNISLAFDELVSNAIFYAFQDKLIHEIDIKMTLNDGLIVITLAYGGKEFNPLFAPEPDLDAKLEDRKIGGLGIFLVRQFMDTMDYQRIGDKNYITISKKMTNKSKVDNV